MFSSFRFSTSSTFTFAFASVLAFQLVGCAHGDTPVRTLPSSVSLSDIQSEKYGSPAPNSLTTDEVKGRVEKILQASHPHMIHDSRADALAAILAATLAEERVFPANTLTQWYAWQAGITGNTSNFFGDYGSQFNDDKMDAILKRRAAQIAKPNNGKQQMYGIARIWSSGVTAQVLVVVEETCSWDAFPKTVKAGEQISLSGICHGTVELPELFVDIDAQNIGLHDVEIDKEGRISATFTAPKNPGTHYLEILGYTSRKTAAASQRWRNQIMMVPFYVDTQPPTLPEDTILEPKENPKKLEDWSSTFLARLNAARKESGLASLKVDARLTQLATQWVADDVATKTEKLHDLSAVLANVGLPIRNGHTLVGGTQFIDEDIWMMLRSPSLRQSLLSPEMSLIGLAFANTIEKHSRRRRILIAAPVGKLDTDKERERFLKSIARWRKREKMEPYTLDEDIRKIAQDHANRVCEKGAAVDDLALLEEGLKKLKRPFRSVSVRSWRGYYLEPTHPKTVGDLALHKKRAVVGMGICQGTVAQKKNQEVLVFLALQGINPL